MLPPTEPELWTACHEHCEPCPSSVSRVDDREGPVGFIVALAGDASADGAYVRCGSFAAAPLFKQLDEARPDGFGAHFLLAYQLPSGRRRWYVAEKDTLDIDQGDKYYADSDADLPPTDPSAWRVARSGAPGAPLTRAVFEGEDDFFDRRFRSLNAGAKKRHERIKNEHTIETWEVRAEAEREKRGRSFEGASTSGPTPGGACDALARLCVGEDDAGGGKNASGEWRRCRFRSRGWRRRRRSRTRGSRGGCPFWSRGRSWGGPRAKAGTKGTEAGGTSPCIPCTCEGGKCGRFLKISRRPRTETKHVRRPSRLRARSPSSSRHCRPRRPPSVDRLVFGRDAVGGVVHDARGEVRHRHARGHALQRRPLARDREDRVRRRRGPEQRPPRGYRHEAGREQDVPRAGAPSDAREATRAKRPEGRGEADPPRTPRGGRAPPRAEKATTFRDRRPVREKKKEQTPPGGFLLGPRL